jgi:hypothetical protein
VGNIGKIVQRLELEDPHQVEAPAEPVQPDVTELEPVSA